MAPVSSRGSRTPSAAVVAMQGSAVCCAAADDVLQISSGLMEKHGIGTDASIPTHINNICGRNYVQVQPPASSAVVPT